VTSLVLKQLREQRRHWVELRPAVGEKPAQEVCFRRPLEAELHRFTAGVTVDHVCEYVEDWRGFTEADLLGPAIGASDSVPFDPELWAAWVRDHVAMVRKIAEAIAEQISAHLKRTEEAAKN
jgi:hypothetical protein